jgi:hypothetical protein
MRILLLITAILAGVLVINGQGKARGPKSDKPSPNEVRTDRPSPAETIINTINNQAPDKEYQRPKDKPKSYLSRLFSPENIPNIGLFLAGIAGIIVGIKTLRKMERQTKATEDAAKAALLNAKALINRERMWIEIGTQTLVLPEPHDGVEFEKAAAFYTIITRGETPASIIESYCDTAITDSENPPYREHGIPQIFSEGTTIDAGEAEDSHEAALRSLSKLQIEMIKNRMSFVHLFGYIKYRIFTGDEGETAFCYTWRARPIGPAIGWDFWEKSGPPEANRKT